ncbi:MAG TPA: hypothetical protein VGE93_08910, partial [Bryobacteraceae bacterium]
MLFSSSRVLVVYLILAVSGAFPLAGADDDETVIQNFDTRIAAGRNADVCGALEIYVKDHPVSWRALYQLGHVYFRLHNVQAS